MQILQRDRNTGEKIIHESYLFYIPKDLKWQLKKQAAKQMITMKQLLITYCKRGLAIDNLEEN